MLKRIRLIRQAQLWATLLAAALTQITAAQPALVQVSEAQNENRGAMEEMIITATRNSTPSLDIPYTVNSLHQKALERELPRNLPEALNDIPGVLVQKTANGQGSPFLRGFTGYRTLALIDGVRYNNSVYRDGPNEYFSLIDISHLNEIELLQGPSSTLYGSDGIGGTLNLHTQSTDFRAVDPGVFNISGSQAYRYASAEDSHVLRSELSLIKGAGWGLNLGYSNKNFGDVHAADIGDQPNTGYDEQGLDVRFDKALGDNWALTLVHQALEQDDVWRTHSTQFAKPFAGTQIGSDQRRLKDQKRSLSYSKLSGTELNGFIDAAQITLSHQRWDEDGDRIRQNGERILDYFDSRMLGLDIQLESHTAIASFVYGFDYYHDRVDSGRSDSNADGSLDRVRIQGSVGDNSNFRLLGAYVQGTFPVSERLTLVAGGRYGRTSAQVGRFQDPDTGLPASFKDHWNSRVGSIRASYGLTEQNDWKVWAGVSQSFRAPNIADLSRFGSSRSNETETAATELEPEKFLTYEIGLKTNRYPIDLAATYYYTDIKNFITSTPTGRVVEGLTEVSKRNSGQGHIQGVEMSAQYTLAENWTIAANTTWLEGTLSTFATTDSSEMTTEPYSRIMPLTSSLNVRWHDSADRYWLKLSLVVAEKADKLSAGDMADTQRIPPGGTPGYTLVNLHGGGKVSKNMEFSLGLVNLLDEAYRSHGSGSNEPGFGVNIGLKARFGAH